ncbi:MAG: aminotransferase class I/II-fold pyridoxal phosphate-dependent enzyme [Bacteroidota bacterium]|jgi:histidinol-phosphate/aromatic aminotransferase/cobyric acid decarboxylase-like protein/GNAT superfamily N-acetyltransferase
MEISLATTADRNEIFKLRYEVYAQELRQHPANTAALLQDPLDEFNVYLIAKINEEIAGFISVTPPDRNIYSIDKYFTRKEIPLKVDEDTYEMRILTVLPSYRGKPIAVALMWAAFRWIQALGGKRILAIGRAEVLDMYLKLGFTSTGNNVDSGEVTFTLIHGEVEELNRFIETHFKSLFQKIKQQCAWKLGIDFFKPSPCYHGGAFFDAIGTEFDDLNKRLQIINADVLDAWFDPAPEVTKGLENHFSWICKTSPPTDCAGMAKGIAKIRGLKPEQVLPGSGSSDLIFLAFREWLSSSSRVLILDPTYGEYHHVLENLIGCQVDRIHLQRESNYTLDLDELVALAKSNYDLIVLVNPNSPTGQHVPAENLIHALRQIPSNTRIWVDETYVEYCGKEQSLEKFAISTTNTVICKSMSKVYALSGLRAAYLCASAIQLEKLRSISPPWAVSLPAQIAALKAIKEVAYYEQCYALTHVLREEFTRKLLEIKSLEVIQSKVNFVLCFLPEHGPDAATVVARCKEKGLFIRDVSSMGKNFNSHTLRIAIKDEHTNRKMLQILKEVIDHSS